MNRHHVSLALTVVAFSIAAAPAPLFRDIAADVGLTFQHVTGATGDHFMPEIMGAGAALLDYDNDGDLDVYVVQGTALDPGKQPLSPPPAVGRHRRGSAPRRRPRKRKTPSWTRRGSRAWSTTPARSPGQAKPG